MDFELVFTVGAHDVSAVRALFADNGSEFFEIGLATKGPGVVFRGPDGAEKPLPGASWRHAS
ncbi:hypothetical protein Nans01_16380 [Nocardiopsis ansamitocini]|uniref:Uncharacterized protein n=1 Tax=Nocardiopsis ansamitocini TaxID=1670832 RepID=A0A9W6P578_9ACTN|nr:hypothetical protein Nans01_16380 [Nocardiopsis ansamitocini]